MGPATTVNETSSAEPAVRIVGIGASAGGLVALEQFLGQVPVHSGLAYIVVQHLDPTHKALLPTLLQRASAIPVFEVKQGMSINPDSVYVIPPNRELTVRNGALELAKPSEPRGMRLPINVLFSSLARAQGGSAIAVILSGMGSDGTLGMQAIRAVGGLTLVQDPASAQFDSMPKSAIAAACVDIVALTTELPARILSYVAKVSAPLITVDNDAKPDPVLPPLQSIINTLQQQIRHDFSFYKTSTLRRRIERRMAIHNLDSLADYAEFLKANTHEADLLFKELLIGVTDFFRDTAVWEYLAEIAMPELLRRRTRGHTLRVWSIGCSTGEEAYSLAMIFSEVLGQLPQAHGYSLQIFASDLSKDAIMAARRGQYPLSIKNSVSPQRLNRFFSTHPTYYQINQDIRDRVLFAEHDVILDPPFTRIDLISCRNLLIYFDPMLQRRLLPVFHYSLRAGGILVLGTSETVGKNNHLFTPLQSKLRVYIRQETFSIARMDSQEYSFPPLSTITKEQPAMTPDLPTQSNDNLQKAADQVLLQVYAPAAVVVNKEGDIVYISGRTGKYLEPAAGKANWNFHAMVREGLRAPLANTMKKAGAQNEMVQLHDLKVADSGGVHYVDVSVQVLHEPAALRGMMMIVFRDLAVTRAGRGRGKKKGANETVDATELQLCREEIESLREETRATREELQSANEELQSTNEELQSTNEELTTSKEEMQSMNEELQTINTEMQSKLDDLALAQSDMHNLLNSVDIAILFLDKDLNVRRYTDRVTRIFSLRESDVGRPLSDLSTSLEYPSLADDAFETLRTLAASEKQVETSEGLWFSVRIIPYRRLDNMIDGVVITLVDITETKKLESVLRRE